MRMRRKQKIELSLQILEYVAAKIHQEWNVDNIVNTALRQYPHFPPIEIRQAYRVLMSKRKKDMDQEALEYVRTLADRGRTLEMIVAQAAEECPYFAPDAINQAFLFLWEERHRIKQETSMDDHKDNPDTIPITEHEGKKYLRTIRSSITGEIATVDVYDVLDAFDVTSHPIGHAIKKLLCAGQRGKGDRLSDLRGAIAAINRAIEQEQQRNDPQEG